MTINPFNLNQIGNVYVKNSKLKTAHFIEKDNQEEPQDMVTISAEAKKKMLLAEVKNEVINNIKNTLENDR